MREFLRVVCVVGVLLVGVRAGQAQPAPKNLNCERGLLAGQPQAWSVTTPGYQSMITGQKPREGRKCLVFTGDGEDKPGEWGTVMQAFDADEFRGKLVRFRAAVRIDAQQPHHAAQLWMRVDRANGQMGFFDNMGDRPIRDAEWKYFEIVGEVAEDATRLNIGMILRGKTTAWLDDASFDVVGSVQARNAESATPLSERGLTYLTAFAKLFGYVRHFHPSDQAADADWERIAVEGVAAVESAASSEELMEKLREIFGPVAPTVQIYPVGEAPPAPAALQRPDIEQEVQIASWEHMGFGAEGAQSIYKSQRKYRAAPATDQAGAGATPAGTLLPTPATPFRGELGGGIACSIPTALYVINRKTVSTVDDAPRLRPPPVPAPKLPTPATRYSGDDRATRLADVVLLWNVMQHFYPYFDAVSTDWPAVLPEAMQAAAIDVDGLAFLKTLRRMVARLHDGHGNAWHPQMLDRAILPIGWEWIEDQVVVTRVAAAVAKTDDGPRPGDVVVAIDGQPAAQVLRETEQEVSGATAQWRRRQALQRLAAGRSGDAVVLKLRGADDQEREAKLVRGSWSQVPPEPRPSKVAEVRPGIVYVDVDRINDKELEHVLPRLEQAKGIIFDFRGYPRDVNAWLLFSHIIDKPVTSPQWNVPVYRFPNQTHVEFARVGEWNIAPAEPYLKAPKAFLIDGRAISYAESCLGIVEHYKLGELVGEPTAGTNGNVNPTMLPGGYAVNWTGMKVLKHDGSRHHGVGILPTVPGKRTIAGVRAEKDEILERAIELLAEAEGE